MGDHGCNLKTKQTTELTIPWWTQSTITMYIEKLIQLIQNKIIRGCQITMDEDMAKYNREQKQLVWMDKKNKKGIDVGLKK